jgi:hypothetical protein
VADRPPPGLKSIRTLREDRARGRYARPTTTLLLVAVVGVTLTLIAYNLFATRSLESRRNALLEKQRAVQMTLGVEWDSLRDRLEAAALGASGPYQGDFIDRANVTSFVADDFRGHPGLYLRLRLEDAPRAACFLHDTSSSVDHDGGPFGEQPWNLRRAYDSTKILTPRWVDDVKTTDDDLRLRAFEKQYEHAVQDDIPVAARIVKQAEYLLLVLDEDGSDGAPLADGGAAGETADRQVQATTHEARVELLDLRGPRAGNAIFRLRRNAESSFVMASEGADLSPEMRLALQRQVNNCGLANEITKALATK